MTSDIRNILVKFDLTVSIEEVRWELLKTLVDLSSEQAYLEGKFTRVKKAQIDDKRQKELKSQIKVLKNLVNSPKLSLYVEEIKKENVKNGIKH